MPDQRLRFDPNRPKDFDLVVAVGDPLSEHGLTRATLNGGGQLTVEHHLERPVPSPQPHELSTAGPIYEDLGAEEARSLLARAAQFDWDRRFPGRPGLPDEAVVKWSLLDRGGNSVTMRIWLRDAEKGTEMAGVLNSLRKGVDRASKGQLYL